MDSVFWVTGAIVWAVFALMLCWLLVEVAFGFCLACSYARYIIASARKNGVFHKLKWLYFVPSVLRIWFDFIGSRRGSIKITNQYGGTWNWIGDWRA